MFVVHGPNMHRAEQVKTGMEGEKGKSMNDGESGTSGGLSHSQLITVCE